MNTHTINGFDVIAHSTVDHGIRSEVVILGHRAHAQASHEYVVASVQELSDTSWGQGHYSFNLESALRTYNEKGGK